MDSRRAARWAGRYLLGWVFVTLLAGGLLVAGIELGVEQVYDTYQGSNDVTTDVLTDAAPGLFVALLGVLVWQFGTAFVLFQTFGAALRAELAETYDTEQVKSDILQVLDGRLSDMQQDLQGVNRDIRELQDSDESFDFQDE